MSVYGGGPTVREFRPETQALESLGDSLEEVALILSLEGRGGTGTGRVVPSSGRVEQVASFQGTARGLFRPRGSG